MPWWAPQFECGAYAYSAKGPVIYVNAPSVTGTGRYPRCSFQRPAAVRRHGDLLGSTPFLTRSTALLQVNTHGAHPLSNSQTSARPARLHPPTGPLT